MTISKYVVQLDLKPQVKLGQRIPIVNSFTEAERECCVAYAESKQRGRSKVALEFSNADGDFWHVYSGSVRFDLAATRPNAVLERLDSTSGPGVVLKFDGRGP